MKLVLSVGFSLFIMLLWAVFDGTEFEVTEQLYHLLFSELCISY